MRREGTAGLLQRLHGAGRLLQDEVRRGWPAIARAGVPVREARLRRAEGREPGRLRHEGAVE